MTDDEARIIQACLAGNGQEFEVLVKRYEAHVKALAWNITGSAESAMEVSQEAFWQAFRGLERFDQEKSFKKWLLGITAKRSLDWLRKQKTFLNFFKRYSLEVPIGEEEVKPIEESPLFSPLLKRLNERERTALCLQINENYTAGEIGRVLECSENSVRVTLFKARKKLKKALRESEVLP